ncbi:CARDB domain-containing protein, partial [Paenibacillus sp. y28]
MAAIFIFSLFAVYVTRTSAMEAVKQVDFTLDAYSRDSQKNIVLDVGLDPSTIKRYEVYIDGANKGQIGTLVGSKFELTVDGQLTPVYSQERTDPGHHIWRLLDGKSWWTQGDRTAKYEITGGCIVNGISQCPGPIPEYAKNVATGMTELVHGDLRDSSGRAATTAYEVERPQYFWFKEADINLDERLNISSDLVFNVKINKEKSSPDRGYEELEILEAGSGDSGFGMIKVAKFLDSESDTKYEDITGGLAYPVQGRNYFMPVLAFWDGYTYAYKSGYVKVYYDTTTPDLVADSIELTSPLKIGEAGSITVTFHNEGKAVKDDFKVAAFAAGSPLQGSPQTVSGMAVGERKTLTFPFTFKSADTVYVEFKVDYGSSLVDNGVIKEDNEDNNYKDNRISPDLGIDGDFGIPTEVTLRDPIPITPKDFDVPAACGYE